MRAIVLFLLSLVVAGCTSDVVYKNTTKPYTVRGNTYYPLSQVDKFKETGVASWYGDRFDGRKTASGDIYDKNKMTAAHKTLPFGTRVRVHNSENGKSAVVIINDRGPFVRGRVIDVSQAAARKLGMVNSGVVKVNIEVLD